MSDCTCPTPCPCTPTEGGCCCGTECACGDACTCQPSRACPASSRASHRLDIVSVAADTGGARNHVADALRELRPELDAVAMAQLGIGA